MVSEPAEAGSPVGLAAVDPRFAALLTCAPPAGTEAFVSGKPATVTPGQVVFCHRPTTRRIPDVGQRPDATPRNVAGETPAAATGDL